MEPAGRRAPIRGGSFKKQHRINNMKVNNIIISVATIVQNNEDIIEEFMIEVCALLEKHFRHYELIILDNGSTDETVAKVSTASKTRKNIRFIILSKHYDDEIAYTAALENAIGDYVVLIDCVYDPPELIPDMVDICASGKDCVLAEYVGKSVDPIWYRALTYFFYKLFSLAVASDVKTTFTDYICFSRNMVEAIIKVKGRVRWTKFMNIEVGYRREIIQFQKTRRSKRKASRKSLKKFLRRLEMLFSSSEYFLQAANLLSFAISFLSFTYIIYAFAIYFFKPDVAEGWASTSVVLATFFGFMFLILGIIGEYVSVIHKETKKGPLYHIAREVSTADLYDLLEERNVE